MAYSRKLCAYLAAVVVSSLIYTTCGIVVLYDVVGRDNPWMQTGAGSFWRFALEVAPPVWAFIAGAALLLMLLPLCMTIWLSKKLHVSGPAYFAAAGACTTLIIGCVTSTLAPKPLFIEDQTFAQGFMIAAERQGALLILAGIVGGLVYWFIGEREATAR